MGNLLDEALNGIRNGDFDEIYRKDLEKIDRKTLRLEKYKKLISSGEMIDKIFTHEAQCPYYKESKLVELAYNMACEKGERPTEKERLYTSTDCNYNDMYILHDRIIWAVHGQGMLIFCTERMKIEGKQLYKVDYNGFDVQMVIDVDNIELYENVKNVDEHVKELAKRCFILSTMSKDEDATKYVADYYNYPEQVKIVKCDRYEPHLELIDIYSVGDYEN